MAMPEALSLSPSSLTSSSALKPLHSEYPSHPRLPAVYLQLAVSLFVQFGGSEKKIVEAFVHFHYIDWFLL